ncbi:MAG: 50S ribosomal protein L24 [Candidatus Pacebacteria bacterium]|nr:50S ribosomal protein L24 [Candidatus Paceibacterota bacterium]
MKIKTGDTVIVISGSRKDKGKQGKVLKTLVEENKVVVEGVNLKKKVTRNAQGGKTMVDVEFPVHVSNVAFYDEKAKKATKLGASVKDGKKVRVAKASGTEIK